VVVLLSDFQQLPPLRAFRTRKSPKPARSGSSTATTITLLNRRALDVAIGAIHAAVAREGPQNLAAAFAVIKKLAGIHGHPLCFRMAAIRTGYC